MGGDGGVIASNRRYMRGAGTADCTADAGGGAGGAGKVDPALAEIEARRAMVTCALTNQPLQFEDGAGGGAIVVCPYGRLYNKEPIVEALLRRKRSNEEIEQLSHIRTLKDLREIRVKTASGKPVCPITNKELNGKIAAYATFPGNTEGENNYNVFSERAFTKEMKDMLDDYGPIEEKIRLIPPPSALEDIKRALEEKRAAAAESKKNKKKSKKSSDMKDKKERKRKRSSGAEEEAAVDGNDIPSKKTQAASASATASVASNTKNEVLSSLFTKPSTKQSEKERKDSLFAR